jgi:predicted dehydrogenase
MFSTKIYSTAQSNVLNTPQAFSPDKTALKQVRVGMLGVGRWGSHLLRNFLNHPSVTVKAVIDPLIDNLTRAKEWVDDTSTIEWLTDWQALFALELDAIVVATPAETHYPIIKAALRQGIPDSY